MLTLSTPALPAACHVNAAPCHLIKPWPPTSASFSLDLRGLSAVSEAIHSFERPLVVAGSWLKGSHQCHEHARLSARCSSSQHFKPKILQERLCHLCGSFFPSLLAAGTCWHRGPVSGSNLKGTLGRRLLMRAAATDWMVLAGPSSAQTLRRSLSKPCALGDLRFALELGQQRTAVHCTLRPAWLGQQTAVSEPTSHGPITGPCGPMGKCHGKCTNVNRWCHRLHWSFALCMSWTIGKKDMLLAETNDKKVGSVRGPTAQQLSLFRELESSLLK